MAATTYFFAGANSGSGFQNLFEEILDLNTARDLMILKGCPGVGKNTFMRKIGRAMEEAGTTVEYICCSGDPDSLDGVVFPELHCAVVDGTSPHVLEPRCPAAVDRIVDLGQFCDINGIKSQADNIRKLMRCGDVCMARANHCLRAAHVLEQTVAGTVRETFRTDEALRMGAEIIQKEIPGTDRPAGTTVRRFLGSITRQGYIWRFDTVDTLCPRVYKICDRWGQGGILLKQLHSAAVIRGWNTIVCPSPETPETPEHLLIPDLGLAFVTSRPQMEYSGRAVQELNLDLLSRPADEEKLCSWEQMAQDMREDAVTALQEAGASHEQLEKIYNPYIDFEKVQAVAELETSRLLGWLSENRV